MKRAVQYVKGSQIQATFSQQNNSESTGLVRTQDCSLPSGQFWGFVTRSLVRITWGAKERLWEATQTATRKCFATILPTKHKQ